MHRPYSDRVQATSCDPGDAIVGFGRLALFIQIDGRWLAHCTCKLAKLRVHLFHLLLEMALINCTHFLRVLCMQQPLRKLEARRYIFLSERDGPFVHLLRRRIG